MTPRLPFGRAPVSEEVNAELAFHLEMTIRELMERGMTRSQAQAEAERRFGDVDLVNAECRRYGTERDRRAERAEYRSELRQDIAFAIRQLAKARAFSAVAIVTLALGIGATAAVFSALDAVVLRPLPFDHPERIVEIEPRQQGSGGRHGAAVPELVAMRDSRIFEYVAGSILNGAATVMIDGIPEFISAGKAGADYFAVFGVRPALGRPFSAEEDSPGGPSVAVISHRLWLKRFNGDSKVIGRQIEIDQIQRVVIGVMPASFDITRQSEDLWTPLGISTVPTGTFGPRYLGIVGRLRPGQDIVQARAAATAIERRIVEPMPGRIAPVSDFDVVLPRFVDSLVGDYRSLLFILLGAVGFVLLIACGNVANLLLARGTVRARELAIRAALGAGRGRLIRQLLTESFVLAVAGAAVGLAIAYALLHVIIGVSPENVPRLEQAGIDWRVLAFTLGLALTSCIVFGLLPALRVAKLELQGALREGGRGSTAGRERLRATLVAAEVALAITLLVGSGLLIRTAWRMQRVDPGFDAPGVLAARLLLPAPRYPDGASVLRAYDQFRDAAARIPGVKSASLVSDVPLSGGSMRAPARAEEQPPSAQSLPPHFHLASDGYFALMGMRLVAGRDISVHDDASSPTVVVINEALARKLWPGAEPRAVLGRRMDALSSKPNRGVELREIVGVVADVHNEGLDRPSAPEYFIPVWQTPEPLWKFIARSMVIVLRSANSAVDPESLTRPLARTIAKFDASLPVAESKTMTSYLAASLATARMNTLLLSLLGGIALVLAMVGIYGVVSYFVSQRTHEIGIRMALGASPRRIWELVVRRGLSPIAAGLVLGLILSTLTTKVLEGHLFGVTPHDPLTLTSVTAILLFVGLVASYVPARRAMRVQPVVALNEG